MNITKEMLVQMDDKPTLASLTNRGSILGTLGAALLLIGEPMLKGIKPEPIVLIGYACVLIGVLAYAIGNRRSRGKLIAVNQAILDIKVKEQSEK